MRLTLASCVVAIQFGSMVAGANAQTMLEAGTLTCSGGEGIGLVLGSTKSYACTFTPASGAAPESYNGTITKIGLDIGVTSKSVMVWTVLSSSGEMAPRALAGNFAGATADASVGVGGGAKVLVGGSKDSIMLQPVSIQGQTGLNLAVGVAELSLR